MEELERQKNNQRSPQENLDLSLEFVKLSNKRKNRKAK